MFISPNSTGASLIFLNDITECNLTEETDLRNIVLSTQCQESLDGILMVDRHGRVLSYNRKFVEMWGIPSEVIETGSDEHIKKWVIGKLAEPQEYLQKVNYLYGHRQERSRETVLLIDGRTFDYYSAPMFGPDTRYYGRVWYFRDTASGTQALEKLRKSFAGTIRIISLIIKARDPYTAGHQKRVSALARAIAQEMDFPKGRIDDIRMAGSVHDIGKISVPAEILSKPTTLTDIEFNLIKAHSQAGYDILKDADLPSLVVEMVFQHHERLDGSGYPRGLKDGQILPEAQIICVADVVEAIASHRPYRSALGIEIALNEIKNNKGILYDAEVADTCVRVFKDEGFTFDKSG